MKTLFYNKFHVFHYVTEVVYLDEILGLFYIFLISFILISIVIK